MYIWFIILFIHQLIMNWSSSTFYHGKLYAAPLVRDQRLEDLHGVTQTPLTRPVLRMIDTQGKHLEETPCQSLSAPSFANLGEAAIVIDYVKRLVQHGVTPGQIAVIAPYKAQVGRTNSNKKIPCRPS